MSIETWGSLPGFDVDVLERVVSTAFENAYVPNSPSEQACLLTESVHAPKLFRKWVGSVFFETYGCPAVGLHKPPVLALYGIGRSEGCSLDLGFSHSTCCRVVQGHVFPHEHNPLESPIQGRVLTEAVSLWFLEHPEVRATFDSPLRITQWRRGPFERVKNRQLFVSPVQLSMDECMSTPIYMYTSFWFFVFGRIPLNLAKELTN